MKPGQTALKGLVAKASVLFLLIATFAPNLQGWVPATQAALDIIGSGQYNPADSANGGNATVTLAFNDLSNNPANLDNTNAISCPGGVPTNITVCYDPAVAGRLTYDVGSWNTPVAVAIYRNEQAATSLPHNFVTIAFSAANVIQDGKRGNAQITLKGFGGISADPGLTNFGFAEASGAGPAQSDGVTGVTGADSDTTTSGLNGADFTVTWTPNQAAPAGFVETKIFIVPDATSLTSNNVETSGCNSSPCVDRGRFVSYLQNSHTLPSGEQADSERTAWNAATSYKACVFIDADVNTLDCSSAFSVTSDSVTDITPPRIDHISAHSYISGSGMFLYAIIKDDQTTNYGGGGGQGSVQCFHDGGQAGSVTTQGTVALVSGTDNVYECQTNTTLTRSMKYYWKATDAAGNTAYFTSDPATNDNSSTTDAQAAAQAVTVLAVSAGARSVSGTVTDSGTQPATPLQAGVILGGLAVQNIVSGLDGTYTLSSVPGGQSYSVMSAKSTYCEQGMEVFVGSADVTGFDLSLNAGQCNTFAPGGNTAGDKPSVTFSGPPEGQFGVPLGESIRVGFSQALKASTVNDTDATGQNDNIYLTTGSDRIAGTVTWCASKQTSGCSGIPDQDTDTILFNPSADLTANTGYTLIITTAVQSESNQSVQGISPKPGVAHALTFTTGAGTVSVNSTTYGTGGDLMPPFVQSATPAPGIQAPSNTKVVLEFNEQIDSATVTSGNIQLLKNEVAVSATVTLDNDTKRLVTIAPASSLTAGEYTIRVKGAVQSATGVSMRPLAQATEMAYEHLFTSSGTADAVAPTIYADAVNADGATGVPVGAKMEFGMDEPMDPATLTSTNVTLKRGSTLVSAKLKYDPGPVSLSIIPNAILSSNTNYTVTFGTGVTDLSGKALTSARTFSFTTGAADTTAPNVRDARCDDTRCTVSFTERVKSDSQAGNAWAASAINKANYSLSQGGNVDFSGALAVTYISEENRAEISGFAALTKGGSFTLTVSNVQDLSGNVISNTDNSWSGVVENSAETYGSFGEGVSPPTMGGGAVGGEFKPEGFGNFTGDQFAFGNVDMAFPFNSIAGEDSNVFQVRFSPGKQIVNGDQFIFTFPSGTGVGSAAADTFSPFNNDLNEFGSGTVTISAVASDATARTVTVTLGVTGTTGASDTYTVDLRSITNPSVPKDPTTSGYTVGIKVMQGGAATVNKTSMPYFINKGGSNSITVTIQAGSGPDNVNGSVFLFGGSPAGPLDKNVTITNGTGTASFTSLNDGCYRFGTEPGITLGGTDYFGQLSPEPICVNSGNTSATKTITLISSAGGNATPLTIKFSGLASFNGADIDIFAGGPGSFVMKTLTGVNAPDSNGYTLNLPQAGHWFVGVGPAMSKGASATQNTSLPGVPPPPIDLNVSGSGAGATITTGRHVPNGVTFDSATKTLTFSFAAADKTVSGTVKDGSGDALQNVNVFMHSQGFGAPIMTQTDSGGAFTLNLSNYGSYEIVAFKDGLPPSMKNIEIRQDGADAGTDPDIFFKGKQITGSNPLVLTLKKPAYYISGKVLDASNNAISYAPVFASDTNGNFAGGGTDSNGNYTIFVDAGTWTVKSELPPDKTDACGTYSKTVVVTNANQTSQNITPTAGTCYTISGTVSVGGATLNNVPLFVNEWDTANSRPAAGAFFRPASTDSSGAYSVKVAGGGKTYRVGTFDPNYGELSTTVTVNSSNVTGTDITVADVANVVFNFTGGTSSMNAFVELKKSDDSTRRKGKEVNGLSSALTISMPTGTYNYFVDIFNVGKYEGTVIAGGDAVTIDLSGTTLVTLSGNVKDGSTAQSTDLAGAQVSARDTTTGQVVTAQTDSSGDYTLNLKSGSSYAITPSLAGHTPGQAPATVLITENTADYDIGGASQDQEPLSKAGQVISGTVNQSDGSTAVSEGFVSATESTTGIVVTAPVEPDGSYDLPVSAGTWTVDAKAPLHAETELSSSVIVTEGTDATGQDITLTADATKSTKAASKALAANTGGVVDDTQNTGVKLNAGAGVLESGSGDVTVEVKQTYSAPDTATFGALSDAALEISATGTGAIKNLNGNAELQIDYTDLLSDLPSGVSESDLQLVYYSGERGDYVPVEGGFTVDATNNTITGNTSHLTTFAVVYPNAKVSSTTTTGSARHSSPQEVTGTTVSGGGEGGGTAPAVDPNTTTSNVSTSLAATVAEDTAINRALKVEGDLFTVDAQTKMKKARLTTTAGKLTLKPNKDATVSVEIPADTEVTASQDWNNNITPPLIKPVTLIHQDGESVKGSDEKLKREQVDTVVRVGSTTSRLTFSKPVSFTIPVSKAKDGAKVKVYFSEDGNNWELLTADTFVVQGGKVVFPTDHFSYFAVVPTGEVDEAVAAAAPQETAPAEGAPVAPAPVVAKKTLPFTDTVGHWSQEFVQELFHLGVINGKSATRFAPDDAITRAEITKIALNAFGYEVPEMGGAKAFTDVDPFAWYAPYLQVAKREKIVGGYADGSFKPNQPVTRAEALKILFGASGVKVDPRATFLFKDTEEVSWYMKFVAFAKNNDVVSGYPDGTFRPGAAITRAEVVKIAVKIMGMQ